MKKGNTYYCQWPVRLIMLTLMIALVLIPAHAADWNGALKTLQNGMASEQTKIDISAYKIPREGFWEKYRQYEDMGYFPWYVGGSRQGWHNGEYMTAVAPNYLNPSVYNRTAYERRVKEIMDETVYEGMSHWQIALSLHDYLIANSEYDERYYTDYQNRRTTGYDLLVNGTAVCEGYAQAYMDLMNRAGVPCIIVRSSEEMNHCWNLVKLGSQWYHVDVTWDDPSFNKTDVEGYVGHEYFLLSDATISDTEHRHYGWSAPYKCTSTSYEWSTNPYWKDVTSQIIWIDDSVSFWRDGDNRSFRIKRRDANTGKSTVLHERGIPSINVGSGNYFYWCYGLSYWNGMLYFSDTTHIYQLPLTGGTANVIYTQSPSSGRYIQGCQVKNGFAYITLNTHGGIRTDYRVSLPVSGHSHSYTITDIAPTCTDAGYTFFSCSCGSNFTSGHMDPDPNNHTYRDIQRKEPTVLESGYAVQLCSSCGNQRTLTLAQLPNPFKDVPAGQFYTTPVLWAVSKGITTGMTTTTFVPDGTCTRGQVVTFLWRAMGSPEPSVSVNPFTDVHSGDYFYKAVLWAVEKGITTGMTATTFAPNASCTRAQVVTFLHRTAGNPAPGSGGHSFTDVSQDYYYTPMLWAVNSGITTGMAATTFSPGGTCTRGQIVTFLHRYMTE